MSRRCLLLALLIAIVPAWAQAEDKPRPLWIVVTAPAFETEIKPLCEHRKARGMRVEVVRTTDILDTKEIRAGDSRKLRDHIDKLYQQAKGPCYLLLVGVVAPERNQADAEKTVLPALAGTVGRMKNQPSDHGFGLPDKDGMPKVAVGRLPARTIKEARGMIRKTIAYEQDRLPGPWRRRVTIFAGAPMFTPAVDSLVESIAMSKFAHLDLSWSGHAIYHNPSSRFCLPDDLLRKQSRAYLREGQAIALYLGHSDANGFSAERARYFDREDWAELAIERGPGIFATFGCLGCQLQGVDGEGYGLAALRNPRGPVAVLGSHGICFAAMVELAADGFMASVLGAQPPKHLGESWLKLEAALAKGKLNPISFHLLDALDGDSTIPQETQRLEHLEMFVLLSDPALELPTIAQDLVLTCAKEVEAGTEFVVTGKAPDRLEGATVRLSLDRPLASPPADLQSLPAALGQQRDATMLANHLRANRFELVSAETTVAQGKFAIRLLLPKKLPWTRLTLRAYAASAKEEGMGVLSVSVKSSNEKSDP